MGGVGGGGVKLTGISAQNVVCCFQTDWTPTEPLSDFAACLTIARPRPVPLRSFPPGVSMLLDLAGSTWK